jgi:hypothetical protein
MKKIINTVIVTISLIASGQSMFGQVPVTGDSGGGGAVPTTISKMPPSLPMLTSKAALKTFAIESARSAFLELKSPGMVNPSWSTGAGWLTSMRAVDVLAQFNALKITVPMANIEDYVHAIGTIQNQMGKILFTADSWSRPVSIKGGYELPQMWFGFVIAKNIPIKFDRSIRSARARFINEQGQTVGNPIEFNVVNGEVDFQGDLAGGIILELRDQDGNVFEYDLRQENGPQINVEQVAYNGSASYIDGMYDFTDPTVIDWQVWSWNGIGQNPAFEVTMTSKGLLPVGTHSNEGALATGFYVRAMDSANWQFYPLVPEKKFSQLPLNIGVWYIVPIWNPNDFREPDPDMSGSTQVIPGEG